MHYRFSPDVIVRDGALVSVSAARYHFPPSSLFLLLFFSPPTARLQIRARRIVQRHCFADTIAPIRLQHEFARALAFTVLGVFALDEERDDRERPRILFYIKPNRIRYVTSV